MQETKINIYVIKIVNSLYNKFQCFLINFYIYIFIPLRDQTIINLE